MLELKRGRAKPEFVWKHCRGICVETLIGFRLTRLRCKDAETDLEEAMLECHRIAVRVLRIWSS
jgi:hypothetical protein